MQERHLAPSLGVAATLAVVFLVVAPYFVVSELAVGRYYGVTFVGPWLLVVFGSVVAFAFVGTMQDRADALTVAGVTLGLGIVMTLIAAVWAFSVPGGLVAGLSRVDLLAYHRWAVVGVTLVVPASAIWYAMDLF